MTSLDLEKWRIQKCKTQGVAWRSWRTRLYSLARIIDRQQPRQARRCQHSVRGLECSKIRIWAVPTLVMLPYLQSPLYLYLRQPSLFLDYASSRHRRLPATVYFQPIESLPKVFELMIMQDCDKHNIVTKEGRKPSGKAGFYVERSLSRRPATGGKLNPCMITYSSSSSIAVQSAA